MDGCQGQPCHHHKAQWRKLVKTFHPDGEAKVSEHRKAQLDEAVKIFNAIKFALRDDKPQS